MKVIPMPPGRTPTPTTLQVVTPRFDSAVTSGSTTPTSEASSTVGRWWEVEVANVTAGATGNGQDNDDRCTGEQKRTKSQKILKKFSCVRWMRKCKSKVFTVTNVFAFLVLGVVIIATLSSWVTQYLLSTQGLEDVASELSVALGDGVQKFVDKIVTEAETALKRENETRAHDALFGSLITNMQARLRANMEVMRSFEYLGSVCNFNMSTGIFLCAKAVTARERETSLNTTHDYCYLVANATGHFVTINEVDYAAELARYDETVKNDTLVLGRTLRYSSSYNLQAQSWYQSTLLIQDPTQWRWAAITWSLPLSIQTLSGSMAVYKNLTDDQFPSVLPRVRNAKGEVLTEVHTVTLYLNAFNEFLLSLRHHGRIVVIDNDGRYVGADESTPLNSASAPFLKDLNDDMTVSSEANNGFYKSLHSMLISKYGSYDMINTKDRLTMKWGGQTYWVNFNQVISSNMVWIIIVVSDSSFYLSKAVFGTKLTAGLSTLIAVISVFGSALATCFISVPMRRIASRMDAISHMEFQNSSFTKKKKKESDAAANGKKQRKKSIDFLPKVSHIEEVGLMQTTMKKMETALLSFSKYAPMDIVKQILNSEEGASLYMANRHATVMFADIVGFTTVAEELVPGTLIKLLGDYFEAICDTIAEKSGTIDKFIGDAVMALWNAPQDHADHALSSCDACLTFQKRLKTELCKKWEAAGLPQLRASMGISTGHMLVGNLGSVHRLSYTAIGDTVNLGSRLEGLTRRYGVEIIISEITYEAVKHKYLCRLLDRVAVKGKSKPIRIYELVEERRLATDQQIQLAIKQEEALNHVLPPIEDSYAGEPTTPVTDTSSTGSSSRTSPAYKFNFLAAQEGISSLYEAFPDNKSLKILHDRFTRLASLPIEKAYREWPGYEILHEKS